MANTKTLKDVEQHVRSWCFKKYSIEVYDHEEEVKLLSGGVHRFDVVATLC